MIGYLSKDKDENEKLRAALLSYTFAQKHSETYLQKLQEFLSRSDMKTIKINDLKEKIDLIKNEEERIKDEQELIAELFTEDKTVRAYRFGSDFCPKCHMFKNYEKECPFCNYLEMTI